ncbi:MAG: hypothetical protein E7295_06845 [Lachnospiraceae bacterium]|jgi:hypothetical protein|nr:hypothetical protein [Lachnospiraceae bacterium]
MGERTNKTNQTKLITWGILGVLGLLFVGILILLEHNVRPATEEKKEMSKGYNAYFNGEITEVTRDYMIVQPTEGWTWKETSRIKIPATQLRKDDRGEAYDTIVSTQVFKGAFSDLKLGDQIRVVYNENAVEWTENEALLNVVFMLYRLEDIEIQSK